MTAPEKPAEQDPKTPEKVTPNAPNFVPNHDAEVLREMARLSKERDDALDRATKAEQRASELENTMTEAEKANLEKRAADAEAEVQRLTAAAETATRTAALAGKVADPALALKALDPTKHLNEDGTVKVEALLADHPALAPTGTVAATAADGGGGPQGGGLPTLDTALASGSTTDINAAFDAALKGGK